MFPGAALLESRFGSGNAIRLDSRWPDTQTILATASASQFEGCRF